jgi:hypothetical protein
MAWFDGLRPRFENAMVERSADILEAEGAAFEALGRDSVRPLGPPSG